MFSNSLLLKSSWWWRSHFCLLPRSTLKVFKIPKIISCRCATSNSYKRPHVFWFIGSGFVPLSLLTPLVVLPCCFGVNITSVTLSMCVRTYWLKVQMLTLQSLSLLCDLPLSKKFKSLEFCYWSTWRPPHEVVYFAIKQLLIKLAAPW